MANNIGAKIRFIRKLHGLSQEKLGNAIGYSRPAISNYEASTRAVTISDLQKIADYFNISIMYFLDEEQTQLEKELQPYIEGIKAFNIENLSPEKKAKITRALYEFFIKYNNTAKTSKEIKKHAFFNL